jgi:hypothetical protein
MNVSVVVPNWNGEKYLSDCIDSLLSQTIKADIIIIENNSTDGSRNLLKKYLGVITLLQSKNLGVAGGFTAGLDYALNNNYDYAALFNNDAVADKDWLKKLVDVMESDKKVGIVTCKFMQFDKKHIDSTGDLMTIFGLPFPRGRNEIDTGQYDHETEIFAGSGGASLYRVSMLRQIGLFDNNFFAYFEDVDISFRAQLAGWKVRYQPESVAYHRISATTSRLGYFASYHTAKNFPLLYIKNMPGRLFFKYLPLAIYWYFRMFAARLIRGGFWAFTKGFLASIALMPKKIIARYHIQKNRQVLVEYIDSVLIHHRAPKPPRFN